MENNFEIVERDLDSYPCPTPEELRCLLESFDYYDKYRVILELMALSGARTKEALKAKMQEFSTDYIFWKYRIAKPRRVVRFDKETNTAKIIKEYKVRTVELPVWFAEKLRNYTSINRYSIDAGYLFYCRHHDTPHISYGQLNNILSKRRRKLHLTRVWKVVLKHSKHKREQYNTQKWYAVCLHGIRRFYVSEMFEACVIHGVQNALVMVGKMLGHERPMHTTSLYLSPRSATKFMPKVYDPDFMTKKDDGLKHQYMGDRGAVSASA